jgi:hypothetical protein
VCGVRVRVAGAVTYTHDPLAGNVIAWQYPKDIDLSGIEFKAMASGSHNVDSDIVYVPALPPRSRPCTA